MILQLAIGMLAVAATVAIHAGFMLAAGRVFRRGESRPPSGPVRQALTIIGVVLWFFLSVCVQCWTWAVLQTVRRSGSGVEATLPSRREQILAALALGLQSGLASTVRRNEALPERVPNAGLVILRDGEPGEPDVTLNPRTEFYSHRVEIETYVPRDPAGGGEAALDALLGTIGSALRINPTLGGLAENLTPSAPETGALAIEGAAPILTARLTVIVDYLVSDPLAG